MICGQIDQNRNGEQMSDEMRKDAVEHFGHRPSRIARHDEAVQSDRRRDHADLGGDDLDDAEPQRIVAERLDQRQHDRNREHQDRDLVHEGAEHDVAEQDDGQDHPGRDRQAADPGHQVLRHLGQREEIAEDRGAEQDHRDHAGAVRRAQQRAAQATAS